MFITKKAHGPVMVIHLAGKFEGGPDRERLLAMVHRAIADGHRELVVSFLGVRYLASNGVGIMIALHQLMEKAGGRIILCNLNERALAVVYIMRLQEVFVLEKNIRTSLARLRRARETGARRAAEAEA